MFTKPKQKMPSDVYLQKNGYTIKCKIYTSLLNDFKWLGVDIFKDSVLLASFSSDKCYDTLAAAYIYAQKEISRERYHSISKLKNHEFDIDTLHYLQQNKSVLMSVAKYIEQQSDDYINDNDRQPISLIQKLLRLMK